MSSELAFLSDETRQRFEAKIEQQPGGCWCWTAHTNRDGYGCFKAHGHQLIAHRVAYWNFAGPFDLSLTIDHLCRNRACVNPAHLEPVTLRTNILRGTSPAALRAVATECVQGHAFTPENTIVRKKGWRRCRICQRACDAAYRAKKAAA